MTAARRTDRWLARRLVPAALGALLAVGCSSIGPDTVAEDQFDYNGAIARSSQEQLLLNLVRLRYNEAPVFLRVASVISQYSRVVMADASGSINGSITGGDTAGAGARFTWVDRPTITYTPVSGREFSRNLLTPLPPGSIFKLLQAGWPADLVIRMSVTSINEMDGEIARPALSRQMEPELLRLFELWRTLRDESAVGVRETATETGHTRITLVVKPGPLPPGTQEHLDEFLGLLGAPAGATEIPLEYGRIPSTSSSMAVMTGSIWDVMLNLAWQMEVPAEHVESGRTGPTFRSATHAQPPLEIRHAAEPPVDAFVAVETQGYWFYIPQEDSRSKRVFAFLQLLLSLSESDIEAVGPVVTISS